MENNSNRPFYRTHLSKSERKNLSDKEKEELRLKRFCGDHEKPKFMQ